MCSNDTWRVSVSDSRDLTTSCLTSPPYPSTPSSLPYPPIDISYSGSKQSPSVTSGGNSSLCLTPVSGIVDKGAGYLRNRIFHRDSGFEKVSPQQHVSAVETLRRTKPQLTSSVSYDSPRSLVIGPLKSTSDDNLAGFSNVVGNNTSEQVDGVIQRTAKAAGKRRLSSGLRDDSSSGGGRQRKCLGAQRQQSVPSYMHDCPPRDLLGDCGKMSATIDDSFISQYLSYKVENMDLQPDIPATPSSDRSLSWMCKTDDACDGRSPSCADRKQESPDAREVDITSPTGCYSYKSKTPAFNDGGRMYTRRYRKPLGSASRSGMMSRYNTVNSRTRRPDGAELDSFFNEMGMDRGTLFSTTSPVLSTFENVSSVGTSTTLESRTSNGESSERFRGAFLDSFGIGIDRNEPSSSSTSVIERNARIIKWLCSIRKASTEDDIEFDEGFV